MEKRRIGSSRDEMLGLLADFSDGESDSVHHRELSFSGLADAVCTPKAETVEAVEQIKLEEEVATASLKQQQQQLAVPRLRRRPSDVRRGSCGGGGDGVLLNFYVPRLLTRSMTMRTTTRRRPVTLAAAGQSTAVAAGKARMIQAPLAVGCWPAWLGRDLRDRCSNSISKRV